MQPASSESLGHSLGSSDVAESRGRRQTEVVARRHLGLIHSGCSRRVECRRDHPLELGRLEQASALRITHSLARARLRRLRLEVGFEPVEYFSR